MILVRRTAAALLAPALAAGCAGTTPAPETAAPAPAAAPAAPAGTPATAGALPRTMAARPTSAAVSPGDLMSRVYVFADDSMLGREAGTVGHARGAAYIVAELRRLGLQPAGDGGTFLQTVPMVQRGLSSQASLVVDAQPLTRGTDWLPVPPIIPQLPFGGAFQGEAAVIFGGRAGDVASYPSPEQVRGKVVVLTTPGGPYGYNFWSAGALERFRGAAAVAVATLELTPEQIRHYFDETQTTLAASAPPPPAAGTPFGLIVSRSAAQRLLGADPASLRPGAAGKTVRGDLAFTSGAPAVPAQNIVAILPGSDPALRGQYVAVGAHSDHVGLTREPVDHDSLRAFNAVMRPRGAEDDPGEPSAGQRMRIRAILDSLRAVNPRKVDSVFNGADDDASGSMGVLEIAEALAAQPTKPKRSVLFVWHTAEEKGLFGSEHFAETPTVPRDSIVAQINIDMIGRGTATDLPTGGPHYVQLIGSRRLSTQLGDLVEQVNRDRQAGFRFDYTYDAEGHPDQFYCRSDHYNYARWGIPVVFFSTGGHRDYHQLTDEPQYLDYDKLARVTGFIRDVTVAIADRDQRLALDKPRPDPRGECRQ